MNFFYETSLGYNYDLPLNWVDEREKEYQIYLRYEIILILKKNTNIEVKSFEQN